MLILFAQFSTQAYSADNLVLPTDNDQYSQLVHKAHAQDSTVSFRDLRIAYLNSSASKLTANTLAELKSLRRDMFDAVAHNDAPVIRSKAEAILNIKYIDMDAHKLLRQSCAVLADKACEDRHRFTGLGLLRSIVSIGDGKSCKSAWEVVAVEEEYFVLRMIGEKLKEQSVVQEGGKICDKMQVVNEKQEPTTRYFDINHVFSSYIVQ